MCKQSNQWDLQRLQEVQEAALEGGAVFLREHVAVKVLRHVAQALQLTRKLQIEAWHTPTISEILYFYINLFEA